MSSRIVTVLIGGGMLLSPLMFAQDRKPSPTNNTQAKSSGMSEDMRQAIEFERAKDRAAARQARIEARRARGDQSADRMIEDKDSGRKVTDSKAPGAKRNQ